MKFLYPLLIFISLLCPIDLLAQNTPTQISGFIKDASNQEPVPLANIFIYQHQDSVLFKGANADISGQFSVDLPLGSYDIIFQSIGFQDLKKENIALTINQSTVKLGAITLSINTKALAEVQVIGKRALVEYGLEKKIFNVEKDLNSTGGSAQDILQNIPSVEVDIEGNVSLRGSNAVNIYINGKPSGLTAIDPAAALQQIPATAIKQVEIISNPSAKYEAEGAAGIINIITKRPNQGSLNANASINIGTNNKYDGTLGINFNNKKANYYATYSGKYQERWRKGTEDRNTFLPDTTFRIAQEYDGENQRKSHTLQAGTDFNLSEQTILSLGGTWTWRSDSRDRLYENDFFDASNTLDRQLQQRLERDKKSEVQEYNFTLNHNFTQKGERITFNSTFSSFFSEGNRFFDYKEQDITNNILNFVVDDYYQNQQNDNNDFLLLQLDYTKPILLERYSLETGVRSTFRNVNSNFDWTESDAQNVIPELSNQYLYDEKIHAAYITLARKWDKLEAQVGLRGELTQAEGTLVNNQVSFPNNYFNLFPSGSLTYDIGKAHKFQISVSKRISRPRIAQLNPAVFLSNPLSRRLGNPNLNPTYINTYELGYLKSGQKGTFNSSIYYRSAVDLIRRYVSVDELGNRYFTFENLQDGQTYGLEIAGSLRPTKWLSLNGSGNFYIDQLNVENLAGGLRQRTGQFSTRLMSRFSLKKDWSAQLSGYYRSSGVMPQGTYASISFVDLSVRKSFLEGRGKLTLRVSDIFNTRKYRIQMESNTFTYDASTQIESRIAYLGFTYALRKGKKRMKTKRERIDMKMDDN